MEESKLTLLSQAYITSVNIQHNLMEYEIDVYTKGISPLERKHNRLLECSIHIANPSMELLEILGKVTDKSTLVIMFVP